MLQNHRLQFYRYWASLHPIILKWREMLPKKVHFSTSAIETTLTEIAFSSYHRSWSVYWRVLFIRCVIAERLGCVCIARVKLGQVPLSDAQPCLQPYAKPKIHPCLYDFGPGQLHLTSSNAHGSHSLAGQHICDWCTCKLRMTIF